MIASSIKMFINCILYFLFYIYFVSPVIFIKEIVLMLYITLVKPMIMQVLDIMNIIQMKV